MANALLLCPKEQQKMFHAQRMAIQLLVHKLSTLSELTYQESDLRKKAAVALEIVGLQDLPDRAWSATMHIPLRDVLPTLRAYVLKDGKP